VLRHRGAGPAGEEGRAGSAGAQGQPERPRRQRAERLRVRSEADRGGPGVKARREAGRAAAGAAGGASARSARACRPGRRSDRRRRPGVKLAAPCVSRNRVVWQRGSAVPGPAVNRPRVRGVSYFRGASRVSRPLRLTGPPRPPAHARQSPFPCVASAGATGQPEAGALGPGRGFGGKCVRCPSLRQPASACRTRSTLHTSR
jgi:hypothetical protein